MNLGRFIVSKTKKTKQESAENKETHKGRDKVKQDLERLYKSVAHLFEPFKKAILSMFPKLKPVIALLDKIAILVSKLVTLIIYIAFYLFAFVKGKLFKFLTIVFIVLFLFSIVLSRVINTQNYKAYFEDALSDVTGYQTTIDGSIKVGIVPSISIFANNVSFHQTSASLAQDSSSIKVSVFETNKVKLKFKFLHILFGKLTVDNLQIEGANVVLSSPYVNTGVSENAINEQIKATFNGYMNQITSNAFYQNQSQQENNNSLNNAPALEYSFKEENNSVGGNTEEDLVNQEQVGSFFKSLNTFIVKRIRISPEDINKLSFKRLNLTALNPNSTVVFGFENASGHLERGITGRVSSDGFFFIGKEKHSYKFSSTKDENIRDISLNIHLKDDLSNNISVKGNLDTENFALNADLKADSGSVYYLIKLSSVTDSLINTSYFDSSYFHSKIVADKNEVAFKDIDFKINNANSMQGSLALKFGTYINIANLDLKLQTANLQNIIDGYKEKSLKNRSVGQANTSYFFVYFGTFYNSFFKVFNTTHSFVNLDVVSTDAEKPIQANLNISKDSLGNYYLNQLNVNYNNTAIKTSGLLYPEASQAKFVNFASGNLDELLNIFGLNGSSANILKKIAKNSQNFTSNFGASVQNSQIYFNNLNIKLDELELNNLQVNIEERIAITDVAITAKQESISYDYLLSILEPSVNMVNTNFIAAEEDSFFGIHEKLNISLKLESDEFLFNNISLSNLKSDITLNSTGIIVQKFEVSSEENGKAMVFFSYNKKVNPALAGNISFSNFVLSLEDLNKYAFNDHLLKGKIVLNGRLRSSGMSADGFLNTSQGELRFVKFERFKSNKVNNSKGFFATLSKGKSVKGSKTEVFVNDLYGSLQVFSGKMDFFPVVIDYVYGKNKARSSFEGSVDFANSLIDINGNISNTAKSTGPMSYYFRGSLVNPEYAFTKSDGSVVIKKAAIEQEKKEEKKERTEEAKKIEQQALKEVKQNIKDTDRRINVDSIGGMGKSTDKIKPSEKLRGTDFNNTSKITNPGSNAVDSRSLVPQELGRSEKKVEKTPEQKKIQQLEREQGVENKSKVKVDTQSEFDQIYPSERPKLLDSSKPTQEVDSVTKAAPSSSGNANSAKSTESNPEPTKESENTGKKKDFDPEFWE